MPHVVAVVVEEVMVVVVMVVVTAAAAVGTVRGGVSVTVVVNMYSNAGPYLVERKGDIFAAY